MQFTGQEAEQPASAACLLARKCNRLARKMAANMRNAICVRTQTSKVPTQDILLVSSLFCDNVLSIIESSHQSFSNSNDPAISIINQSLVASKVAKQIQVYRSKQ